VCLKNQLEKCPATIGERNPVRSHLRGYARGENQACNHAVSVALGW
jgi:hypothetical protein